MAKVVFMGTPEFAVPTLDKLAEQHDIVAVYTQPDRSVGRGLELRSSPVKNRAIQKGIPVFQPEKLSQPGESERLKMLKPDFLVIVAYGQILKQEVLNIPRLGCINIHSSLLPRWRGAAPIQWAILSGDHETGVTTQKMVLKLDAGDILMQSKTVISSDDTASALHDRLAKMGAELIIPTLEGLEKGSLKGFPQDDSMATYATKLTKEMEILDVTKTAEDLDRQIRALTPWPGTSVWIGPPAKRERLKIKQAKLRRDIAGHSGQLFERAGMLLLGAVLGSIELLRVQFEGKKEIDAAAFLNGLRGRGQELPLEISSNPL